MKIEFGKLTQEQTTFIFREAMREMSLLEIIDALRTDLSSEDRMELVEQLSDDDEHTTKE